jgi:hypothetical protein
LPVSRHSHGHACEYSSELARWLSPDPICANCYDPQNLNPKVHPESLPKKSHYTWNALNQLATYQHQLYFLANQRILIIEFSSIIVTIGTMGDGRMLDD